MKTPEEINEMARTHANLKPNFDREEEEYYNSAKIHAYESFKSGYTQCQADNAEQQLDIEEQIEYYKNLYEHYKADNAVYKQDLNEMERVKNKLHEQVKTQSETIGMYQEICQEVFGEQNPIYVKQKIANQNKDNAERKYTEVEMIEFANYCGLYDFHIHHQIWVSKINFRTRKTTKELFNEFLTSLNK